MRSTLIRKNEILVNTLALTCFSILIVFLSACRKDNASNADDEATRIQDSLIHAGSYF